MSIKVNCLNPIAACGLDMLGDNYEITENTNEQKPFWFAVPACTTWIYRNLC